MNGEALVQLAMATLACNQKTLASHLGVSPAQISKWKKGDHMSFDMSRRLRDISGIGDRVPGFVQRVGSLDEAKKWERLLAWLAELAEDAAETGYDTPLSDEPDILSWDTLDVLEAITCWLWPPQRSRLPSALLPASNGSSIASRRTTSSG